MDRSSDDTQGGNLATMNLQLGRYEGDCAAVLGEMERRNVARRICEMDYTVWSDQQVPELTDRLGWLGLAQATSLRLDTVLEVAQQVAREGFRHVVLLGMGGSSLAPEVFARVFGTADDRPDLTVLDTTHPDGVAHVASAVDLTRALFVVSSKSGTTLETSSLFHASWDRMQGSSDLPGRHFIAITDHGSPLERLAEERAFRHVFRTPKTVGGRYSALSFFGIVPAALIGVDVRTLLRRADEMAQTAHGSAASENPGLRLGACLGALARSGRDKVTFLTSTMLASFPDWIEQLVAESTGKAGVGIVPVVAEPPRPATDYSNDRVFVAITCEEDDDAPVAATAQALAHEGHPVINVRMRDRYDLGAEMFRWEMATAVAGSVLRINPFDQPDVQLAKELAKRAMAGEMTAADAIEEATVNASDAPALRNALAGWGTANEGDYLAIQAYLAPSADITDALQELRALLGDKLSIATTMGYGPRFLHSTGQLHKGGPNSGLFMQLVDQPSADVAVPEMDFSFAALIAAQARGDYQALLQRGRRAVRVDLGADAEGGLRNVVAALGET